MKNCRPVSTPLDQGNKFQQLSPKDEPFNIQTYQQAIGSLTFASNATWPEVAASVIVMSAYISKPSKESHMDMKHVMLYLKGALNFGLKVSVEKSYKQLTAGQVV